MKDYYYRNLLPLLLANLIVLNYYPLFHSGAGKATVSDAQGSKFKTIARVLTLLSHKGYPVLRA